MLAAVTAVPALVTQAAQSTRRSEQGVVGFRLHRVFDVHAGPYHRHDDMQFAGIYSDGRLIKIRIVTQTIDGRETDARTKANTERQYEHPAPGDLFVRPFDPQHLAEYAFDPPDGRTVHFRALVRDKGHGDGTFTVDAAGNVTAVQYSPSVMPPYARSVAVTIDRTAVLPGYWAPSREFDRYSGRYFLFAAGGTLEIDQDRFVRFASEAAALDALASGRI